MPTEPRDASYHRAIASAYREALVDAAKRLYIRNGSSYEFAIAQANEEVGRIAAAAAAEWRDLRPKRKRKAKSG